MHKSKLKSLGEAKKGILAFYIIAIFFGSRGLYYWSTSHDISSIVRNSRYISQRIWFLASTFGVEEPIFVIEESFYKWLGITPDRIPRRYDTIANQIKRKQQILRDRRFVQEKVEQLKKPLITDISIKKTSTKNLQSAAIAQEINEILATTPVETTEDKLFIQGDLVNTQIDPVMQTVPMPSEMKFQEQKSDTVEDQARLLTEVSSSELASESPEDGGSATTPPTKENTGNTDIKTYFQKPKGSRLIIGPLKSQPKYQALLFGDSLMKGIGPTIAKEIRDALLVKSTIHTKVSSGLARPSFFNWFEELPKNFQNNNFEIAIVFMGTNDNQSMTVNGKIVRYGSENWVKFYTERLAKLMEMTCKSVKHTIWLGLPPMRKKRFGTKTKRLNKIIENTSKKYSCINYMDLDTVIGSKYGKYTSFRLVNKRYRKVRTRDGIHLSRAGGKLVAAALLEQLEKTIKTSPEPENSVVRFGANP